MCYISLYLLSREQAFKFQKKNYPKITYHLQKNTLKSRNPLNINQHILKNNNNINFKNVLVKEFQSTFPSRKKCIRLLGNPSSQRARYLNFHFFLFSFRMKWHRIKQSQEISCFRRIISI